MSLLNKKSGGYDQFEDEDTLLDNDQLLDTNDENNNNNSKRNSMSTSGSLKKKKMVQFKLQGNRGGSINNDSLFDDDEDEYADLTSNMFLDEEQFFNSNYSTKRCIYRLFSYLRPQFWYFVFGFIALGITTTCQLLLPYYFALQIEETVDSTVLSQDFIDKYNLNKTQIQMDFGMVLESIQDFNWYQSSKYLILLILIQIPFTFVRYVLFTIAGFNFVTKLKSDLFRSLLTQEVNYFDPTKSGELNAVVSSDTLILQNVVTVSFSTLFRCLFQTAGGFLILVFLSWRTTLFVLSFIVLFAFGYLVFTSIIHPKYKYIQELNSRASNVVDNAITNIREIRLLNAESKELRSYETELETIYRSSKSSTLVIGFWIALGGLAVLSLVIATFLFILYQVNTNGIKLFQYILYALMLTISSSGVLGVVGEFPKLISSSRRIFSLIDRRPLVSFQGGVTPSNEASISFESVTFHHKNGTNLLNDVTFSIPKGKLISIVGSSSVSKETIFSLIQGLYYPTRGSVYVGRIDTKALDLHFFRTKVYSLTSNTVIFEGTVEQNIRYGLSHLSTQNIIEASKKANLHDFIIGLPHGYDTMLGKGERLNALHTQKISLARAFLRDPSLLLVEESSCMLESSNELLEPLELLLQHRTVVIIPNRLSTLEKSSHIVVLDDSRVAEQGSHNQLKSNTSSYYNSFILKHFQIPVTSPTSPTSNTTTTTRTTTSINNNNKFK